MRMVVAAVVVALELAAARPLPAHAATQSSEAQKAERRGDWRAALQHWKAAYASDGNAEHLIKMGDAYLKLGNTTEARKTYEAYLTDPLALPGNVKKVQAKLASLDTAPGLQLPTATAEALSLPGALPLPVAEEPRQRKGKKGQKAGPELSLPLPGLDSAATAQAAPPPLPLPGLDLPGPDSKKDGKKVAVASSGLDLPPLPLPGAKPERANGAQSAVHEGTKQAVAKPLAAVTPAPERKATVPNSALADLPTRSTSSSAGKSNVLAYVAAGVAVVSLGGGVYAYTQAGSAHSELTGSVHDRAAADSLLKDEARNKTLSFVGLAGGLVAAGISAALFAF